MGKFKDDFVKFMDAGLPILYVDTCKEGETLKIVRDICKANDINITEWNLSHIIDKYRGGEIATVEAEDLANFLKQCLNDKQYCDNRLFVLTDAHYFFDKTANTYNPEVISRLKQLSEGINDGEYYANTCIISPLVSVPKELELYVTIMEPDSLDEEDIESIVEKFNNENLNQKIERALLYDLITRLKGLSSTEINNILSLAISEYGMLTRSALPLALTQKQQMIKKSGILEMIPVTESMQDIGGLENLKVWLNRKAEIFRKLEKAKDFGVDIPKGVLIAGMPGCGKSLTAKAVSKAFDIPLLRMDMGRLMGKYVGESEGNMRRAIRLTEACSPCVLWIDELEKAFAGIGGGGSEVTTRLFGNFLTWMQEKKSLAFVVATANKIDKLPPELLRKGRFDEIFYVDLPKESEREKIIEIHLKKRRKKFTSDDVDIKKLAKDTDGYCGADLEGVVRDGIEKAFIAGSDKVTTENISDAIKETHSLKEIMKGELTEMAKIYKERKFKNASA